MEKIKQKQIDCYVVLYYYNLLDSTQGRELSEVPVGIRSEVELLANERLASELKSNITQDVVL